MTKSYTHANRDAATFHSHREMPVSVSAPGAVALDLRRKQIATTIEPKTTVNHKPKVRFFFGTMRRRTGLRKEKRGPKKTVGTWFNSLCYSC